MAEIILAILCFIGGLGSVFLAFATIIAASQGDDPRAVETILFSILAVALFGAGIALLVT